MEAALFGVLFFLLLAFICLVILGVKILEELKMLKKLEERAPEIKVDLSGTEARLAKKLGGLPDIIVNSITGTVNTHKGKLGELIGYISMKAEYDKIIPLGTIVDFMAIKFPKDDLEGCVHFIDIKTGKYSRLTPDQRKLKALLTKNVIQFKTIHVDEIETQ